MNSKAIDDNIILFKNQYNGNSKIRITLKDENSKNILIFITYQPESITPDFKSNIYFLITINSEEYLNETPIVNCLSDFSFPSLFDNRNLIYSIISTNWNKSTSLLDIVREIPNFILRVEENERDRILVYYGDYKIDSFYQMNDFLLNSDISLYKINQLYKTNNKKQLRPRYVVLTDIYFLLFDQLSENKEIGKLLFIGDIKQLNNSRGSQDYVENLIAEFRSQSKTTIFFELVFENNGIKDFMENVSRKITRLKENFRLFHEEISKLNESNEGGEGHVVDYEKLVLLIKFKEDLLEERKSKSSHIIKELINLYQSVIEVLTQRNDENYKIYLEKMKRLIEKEESLYDDNDDENLGIFDGNESVLRKKKKSLNDLSDIKGFKLSKSYYSMH